MNYTPLAYDKGAVRSNGWAICEMCCPCDPADPTSDAQMHAWGRLFAASPEMREALREQAWWLRELASRLSKLHADDLRRHDSEELEFITERAKSKAEALQNLIKKTAGE